MNWSLKLSVSEAHFILASIFVYDCSEHMCEKVHVTHIGDKMREGRWRLRLEEVINRRLGVGEGEEHSRNNLDEPVL